MGGPRNPSHLCHNRGLVDQFPSEHQIGAPVSLDGCEQLAVALANRGKQDLAQGALCSLANIHQHGYQLVVFRVEDRPNRGKLQTKRNDLGTEEFGNRKNRSVAPVPQLERQGYERMDVAKGAEAGEKNAHALLCSVNARYDGSAKAAYLKGLFENLEAVLQLELRACLFAGLEQRCASARSLFPAWLRGAGG